MTANPKTDKLIAFYGDDFTGSTDAMESLTYGGIKTVLFVRPPSESMLAGCGDAQAIGIAGASRAMSPGEMEGELARAFGSLKKLNPTFVHYKLCSTFDSSPRVGSIGKAIEIGLREFGNSVCPLVVGAPVLQRFCVFGNLFARSGLDSQPFRLDRHPTMKCHPVTPMDESDLRRILRRQTEIPVRLVDVLALDRDQVDFQTVRGNDPTVLLFDTLRDVHLERIGRSIAKLQREHGGTQFVAGSSGAGYAIVDHWKGEDRLDRDYQFAGRGRPVQQTLVVSGSCSPVTERQIAWAIDAGFHEIDIDTSRLHEPEAQAEEVKRVAAKAVELLAQGASVLAHSCRGPSDQRIAATTASALQLGQTLARIVRHTLSKHQVSRIGVTGGDTSGHVARELGIEALEVVGPLAPGSPLCRVRGGDARLSGVEITFKGGQVGHDDFFATLLRGEALETSS